MRKVMVSEEKWNIEIKNLERIALYEAWFHQFGNDECGENNSVTVAIVERISDGKVDMVFPGNIRFLDAHDGTPCQINTNTSKPQGFSDQEIIAIAESMPEGVKAFCVNWGFIQFARAIEEAHGIGD